MEPEVLYVEIKDSFYQQLLKAQKKLDALEKAGIDNWDGYDFAMEYLNEDSEDI